MNSDGIIEVPGMILLFVCLLRCMQYIAQSHVKQIRAFWLAGLLVFVAVIRRELNYLPDLLVPSDFSLLNQSYDWWEDSVLTVIYLVALGLLVYSRHYTRAYLTLSHRYRAGNHTVYGRECHYVPAYLWRDCRRAI